MTPTFWQQVSSSWQSIQLDAEQTAVDLTQFTRLLLLDLESIQEENAETEFRSEIDNDDDFWGGL